MDGETLAVIKIPKLTFPERRQLDELGSDLNKLPIPFGYGRALDCPCPDINCEHKKQLRYLLDKYKPEENSSPYLKDGVVANALNDMTNLGVSSYGRGVPWMHKDRVGNRSLKYLIDNAPTENVPSLQRGINFFKDMTPERFFKEHNTVSHLNGSWTHTDYGRGRVLSHYDSMRNNSEPGMELPVPVVLHSPPKIHAVQIAPMTQGFEAENEYYGGRGIYKVSDIQRDSERPELRHVYLDSVKP